MRDVIRLIGIDFGTSTSVVSYMDYTKKDDELISRNNMQSISYFGGATSIPTIIKRVEDNIPELRGNQVPDYIIETYSDLIETDLR